jgi:hypothetical protein
MASDWIRQSKEDGVKGAMLLGYDCYTEKWHQPNSSLVRIYCIVFLFIKILLLDF